LPISVMARSFAVAALGLIALFFLKGMPVRGKMERPSSGAAPAVAESSVAGLSAAEPEPVAEPVPDPAAMLDRERLREQDGFFESCPAFLDELLAENNRLHQARLAMDGLRSSIESLNQLNDNIRQNADQVCAVADHLSGSAEKGFTLSQNVQSNVVVLAENISSSLHETNSLLEESKKISDILTIMTNIAATTNVLSINASIVAARAGIKGKEFEVVAKEVRKLSVSTEESLNSISVLIRTIQEKILSVSDKLATVNFGMLKEKDSMLSVAGALQGITLAIEVIRSVTSGSGEKAADSRRGLAQTLTLIDETSKEIRSDISDSALRSLKEEVSILGKRR